MDLSCDLNRVGVRQGDLYAHVHGDMQSLVLTRGACGIWRLKGHDSQYVSVSICVQLRLLLQGDDEALSGIFLWRNEARQKSDRPPTV